ncbi:conserved hypothetical protein [Uncinocarpus reesii 1704]|uniref:Phytanoyl-CoA dioxygenase family protein n=1 Tax=Uncinocarpus reesii (strain UAMH 1704) TaxID=336963 RepID=C4JMV5_UNCRE|nr:uncharacterized protein UREG_04163 [Uncinocarpus reesii 1704]EEP79317.1 conserved hypothetical protein [Uncinocarpus reesii 1704]
MSTTTTTSTETGAAPYLTALRRDGFVLIPGLISPEQIATLRRAAAKATHLARHGQWPHIRTVPKQFPPFPTTPPPASEGGIWGVQHLLHPDMPGRTDFANLYFSPKVLDIVEELVGLKGKPPSEVEPLTMELFNLLVSPTCREFALRWHRDDIPTPPTLPPEEELAQLQAKSPADRPQSHAQYNIALYPDSSLIVVPGSHLRARTQAERDADPFEPDMPGQQVVTLQPGDAVFYDSNIFHRGVYKGTEIPAHESDEVEGIRMTLHGSVGLAEPVEEGKKGVRATVVLQHGVGGWVGRDDSRMDKQPVFYRMPEELLTQIVDNIIQHHDEVTLFAQLKAMRLACPQFAYLARLQAYLFRRVRVRATPEHVQALKNAELAPYVKSVGLEPGQYNWGKAMDAFSEAITDRQASSDKAANADSTSEQVKRKFDTSVPRGEDIETLLESGRLESQWSAAVRAFPNADTFRLVWPGGSLLIMDMG